MFIQLAQNQIGWATLIHLTIHAIVYYISQDWDLGRGRAFHLHPLHLLNYCPIITPRPCARGKIIGHIIVVISRKIAISRGLGT